MERGTSASTAVEADAYATESAPRSGSPEQLRAATQSGCGQPEASDNTGRNERQGCASARLGWLEAESQLAAESLQPPLQVSHGPVGVPDAVALLLELDPVPTRAVDEPPVLDVPEADADRTSALRAGDIHLRIGEAVHYLAFRFGARWLSALPAAVLDALPVRPSLSTFEAALAALALVFRLLAILISFRTCPMGAPAVEAA